MKILNEETIGEYLKEYALSIKYHLDLFEGAQLERGLDMFVAAERIFVAGNGGSAAIAEHFSCDFMKGAYVKGTASFNVISLPSNTAVMTALANDNGYENTFKDQLDYYNVSAADLVVLISSSGNSPNIIKAAEFANDMACPVIGLCGFSGGKLKEMASLSFHIHVHNYGIVEDAHQALMHVFAQFLKKEKLRDV